MGWLKHAEYTIQFTGKSFLVRYMIFNFEIIRKINGDEFNGIIQFTGIEQVMKFINAKTTNFYAKTKVEY